MSAPTLSARRLNRALLARQLLLERHDLPAVEAVERLAGMQAQLPRPPFVGLWSRLAGFERARLLAPAHERRLVRATLMRVTLHLVSARDYAWMRPTLRGTLAAGFASARARTGATPADIERWCAAARGVLAERARPFDELRAELAARGVAGDERAMGYAVRTHVPLLQVPAPGAAWGWEAKAPFALAEPALAAAGLALDPEPSPATLVRRYLAAFGPATPADAAAWSGARGLRATFEALRPELATFRDEAGRELFDLPDAPRPDEDAPAPVRFLPDYDNAILGHHDRSRIVPPEHRLRLSSKNGQVPGTVLVEGVVAGAWRTERARGTAALVVQPFGRLARAARAAAEAEGLALVRFVDPGARAHAVRVEAA